MGCEGVGWANTCWVFVQMLRIVRLHEPRNCGSPPFDIQMLGNLLSCNRIAQSLAGLHQQTRFLGMSLAPTGDPVSPAQRRSIVA